MVGGVGIARRGRPAAPHSLFFLAALGEAEALGQGLVQLGLRRARLLGFRHQALPAGAHRRGAAGLAQAALGLIKLLQALSAAGFLHAAQALEILRALGGGEAAEGIHHGATNYPFLGFAEAGTGAEHQHARQGKNGAGAKDGRGHGGTRTRPAHAAQRRPLQVRPPATQL